MALRAGTASPVSLSSRASQVSRVSRHSEADAGAGPDPSASPTTPDARSQAGVWSQPNSPAEAGAGPNQAVQPMLAHALELPISQVYRGGEQVAPAEVQPGEPFAPAVQEEAAAPAPAAPILQRRRLIGKRRHAPAFGPRADKLEEALQEVQRRQEQLSHEQFDSIVALRDWLRTVYCRRERLRNGMGDARRARVEYGRLDREAKLELLRHAIATDPIPETLQQDVLRALAAWSVPPGEDGENADGSRKHKAFAETATLMLTWQGEWGRKDVGEPFASEMSVDALTKHLKEIGPVKELWEKAQTEMKGHIARLRVKRWTASLELCTRTWEKEKKCQLHLHLFMQAERQKIRVRSETSLKVLGSLPYRSAQSSERGSQMSKSAGAGHFYLSIAKIGLVMTTGTVEQFRDYLVNPQWIMAFYSQEKIDADTARYLHIKSKRDVKRYLENINYVEGLAKRQRLEETHRKAKEAVQATLVPRKRVPQVERWLEQQTVIQPRHKFLVLEGPSGLGKTQFALALSGDITRSLHVNCSGTEYPDLRDLDVEQHNLILFDEGSCEMVLNNKKLFQVPSRYIKLGSSATNCHAYHVYVGQKLLVVASNTWSEELEELTPANRDWLVQNSVHVRVTEQLWQDAVDAAGARASQPPPDVAAAGG